MASQKRDLTGELLQVGSHKGKERAREDYYVTPDIAVKELLKREKFEGQGWEPASGNGAIAKFFPGIVCSDLCTDSNVAGIKGVDFLRVDPNEGELHALLQVI